jgi:DHA3 family macrolide efflux protein-like MFS transporter
MRDFMLIWFGQTVSSFGSSLTAFALGIWVYQTYHSVTQFGLVLLLATAPTIFLSPLAGALADRWNRRNLMLASDIGAAIGPLGAALLYWTGHLEAWHVYAATALTSVCTTFRWPAYSAAIPQLVPKDELNRANGMVQTSFSVSELVAPLIAGSLLLGLVGLTGVLLVDFATFLVGIVTLVMARVPDLATAREAEPSLWRDAGYGWVYLRARQGLLSLLFFFALTNLNLGFLQELITPLVLSFSSERALGVIATISGTGMLFGGLLMASGKGPRRLVRAILIGTLLQGVVLMFSGLRPSAVLITAAGFAFLFFFPISTTCSQTLWQRKVAPEVQGRVFAMRQMIAMSSLPVAYLVGGPLSDRLFTPLLMPGGALATSVGHLIGTGRGRGVALFIMTLGALNVLIAIGGFLYSPLRQVEDRIPDAVPDTPAPPVSAGLAAAAGAEAGTA